MLVLLLMLFSGTRLMAQDGFDDNVDDQAPAANVDGFLILGLIAGATLGIRKMKKA
ncbi:hypothetical protein D3C80_1892610 [compost metagenome]